MNLQENGDYSTDYSYMTEFIKDTKLLDKDK